MKKALFVTGVACGNGGYAIAERFASEKYDIFLTARSMEKAEEAAKKLSKDYDVFAKGYKMDLKDKYAAEEIFKDIDSCGGLAETICLNAADLAFSKDPAVGMPFFETDPETLAQVLDANIVGNFRIILQAAKRMREHHKGAIVFISSNSAVRPNMNRVAYISSKGGINSMSKALAVDLGQYGIRSNVIMPGTIKTQRWVCMGDRQISNGTMTPLGDISDFNDIANAVWYLGTDASKNVTGAELVIDGGMSCQIYPQILNKYREDEIRRKSGTEA